MADSSSDKSCSSSSSDDTSESESSSDNEFAHNEKKVSARQRVKRSKNFPSRVKESTSSPEGSGIKCDSSNKPHRENRKYRKQETSKESDDNITSNSSDEEALPKKHVMSSAAVKKRLSSDEEYKYRESSYKSENEMRMRIKQRYIKQEHDRNSHPGRKQHDDEKDEKKQWKEYDKRHDYNGNERGIKKEDGRKYKEEKSCIKSEDYNITEEYNTHKISKDHRKSEDYNIKEEYNTQKISKDHRKRKNEYRDHSSDIDNEKKYHSHYKNEDADYKRSGQREHSDGHRRQENENQRKYDSNDHRRHEHNRRNDNVRDWDIGKYEHLDDDRKIDENWEGFGKNDDNQSGTTKSDHKKEEANYKLSGKLTEYTNTYNGVVIIYNEPPEARKPKTKWRFYPFKGEKALTMLQLHRQSAFLLGRDRKVADIPVDHPSCSKQHAVLQFRLVPYEKPDGSIGKRVKPYIIDLESRNKTHVNNVPIEARKYVELFEKDVIKFGFSSRDYVLLHEKSEDVHSSEDEGDDDEESTETKKKIKKKSIDENKDEK